MVTPLSDLQRDAAFDEDRAGQVGPGREHHRAAASSPRRRWRAWIALVFDGDAVALRAVAGDAEVWRRWRPADRAIASTQCQQRQLARECMIHQIFSSHQSHGTQHARRLRRDQLRILRHEALAVAGRQQPVVRQGLPGQRIQGQVGDLDFDPVAARLRQRVTSTRYGGCQTAPARWPLTRPRPLRAPGCPAWRACRPGPSACVASGVPGPKSSVIARALQLGGLQLRPWCRLATPEK